MGNLDDIDDAIKQGIKRIDTLEKEMVTVNERLLAQSKVLAAQSALIAKLIERL